MKNICDVNFYNTMGCEYPECGQPCTRLIDIEGLPYPSCDKHAERLPIYGEGDFKIYWRKWDDVERVIWIG